MTKLILAFLLILSGTFIGQRYTNAPVEITVKAPAVPKALHGPVETVMETVVACGIVTSTTLTTTTMPVEIYRNDANSENCIMPFATAGTWTEPCKPLATPAGDAR